MENSLLYQNKSISETRGYFLYSKVISLWNSEDVYCLGQKAVSEKSNEITAIPEVLEVVEIKGQVVTIDMMRTQTAIAEKIKEIRADYVLTLKGNQGNLYEDVKLFLMDEEEKEKIRKKVNYYKSVKKAHGRQRRESITRQEKQGG